MFSGNCCLKGAVDSALPFLGNMEGRLRRWKEIAIFFIMSHHVLRKIIERELL